MPRWSRENHCFSCHNNGDAARALLQAAQAGHGVPDDALADTTAWLQKPEGWDHNGGDGPFSDKRLARVAFTAALATAVSTGRVKDRKALVEGRRPARARPGRRRILADRRRRRDRLAGDLRPAAGDVPGPREPRRRRPGPIPRRHRSRRRLAPETRSSQRDRCLGEPAGLRRRHTPAGPGQPESLPRAARRAQAQDGGWGPDAFSPPEPFDTALALLALSKCEPTAPVKTMIARGRKFLISEQLDDGSWTETTRPPGNVSYAERISTTGWATMALLATRPR